MTRPEELWAHEAWLRALARTLVGPADADDAVQEAFAAALRSPPPADRPLRPWLGRVLRNAIKMRWRGEARRARREQVAEQPAAAPAPDELVARARARELVARLVLELPEAERQALLLRYGEGASAADIARALGVPAGTVRWRLSRALARLRERLDAESGGDRRAWQLALAPLAGRGELAATTAASATAGGPGGALIAKGLLAVKTKTLAITAALAALGAGGALVYVASPGTEPARATPQAAASHDAPKLAPSLPAPANAAATAPADADADRARQRARHAELVARIEAGLERRERQRRDRSLSPAAGDRERPELDGPPLDKRYIQQAMQELKPLVVECYELALERSPKLAGRAVVRFTIAGDEEVGGVVAASEYDDEQSSIADPQLAECVQETMYALELPPPEGGGQVTVTYPFVFRPDGPDEPPR